MNTITIATPVFNREDCIGRCIESVMRQSVVPFEHIIVDDGSTDNTVRVVEEYQTKYSHIKLIKSKRNSGENYARNMCVDHSTGDFILFLDSDDQLHDNAFEIVQNTVNENKEYSHFLFVIDYRADEFKNHVKFKNTRAVIEYLDWLNGSIGGDFVHVVKRESFANNRFFEEIRGFEGINWLRIFKRNTYQLYINAVVVHVDRYRSDSVSLKSRLDNQKSIADDFFNTDQFYSLFREDLAKNHIDISDKIARQIILGMALKKYAQNKEYLREYSGSVKFALLNMLNACHIGGIVLAMIILKSKLKQALGK